MNTSHLKSRFVITSIAIQLCATVNAQSEETTLSEQKYPEQIIVTGTKIEQSLQDVEVSAEVFDLARLEREQINEIADLLLKVPNVNTSGGADANFSIRGIGRGGVGGAGQGVTSNIYIDGAPLTSTAINRGPSSLWDVSQVEVLRGPQSSVQGRNALAGAIVVKTVDPTFEPKGKFKATFAEADTYQVAGAYGGTIIGELLAGRIAIDLQGSDGFVTNGLDVIAGQDFNTFDAVTVRGKLLLAPASTPWFTSKLTIDYNESELFGSDNTIVQGLPSGTQLPAFLGLDTTSFVTFDEPVANDNEGIRLVNETVFELNDTLTLRSIVTYEAFETDRTFGDPNDLTLFEDNSLNQFEETIYSGELRLEFNTDNVKGLVGVYYFDSEADTERDVQLDILSTLQDLSPAALDPFISVTPADSVLSLQNGEVFDTENYAIFGQVDWQFSPQWTLGLGARYDVEEFAETSRFENTSVSSDSCFITAPAAVLQVPGLPPLTPLTLPCQTVATAFTGTADEPPVSADFDAFLPRISLTYDINDNSSVFVSASRGYRAGGSFVSVQNNPNGIGTAPIVGTFEPEFLTTLEIGTRNILLDGRLTLNANAFLSDYEDQQLLVDVSNPGNTLDDIVVNAGESTIYGIELLADYSVNDNTNVFLSLGLLETEFDNFPFAVDADGVPNNPANPEFANLAGNSFPGAADVSFTIGASWENDRGLFASSSFTFIGESESDIDNIDNNDIRTAFMNLGLDPNLAGSQTTTSENRTDLTARVGWSNDNMTVYVFGTNLLDEDGLAGKSIGSIGAESGTLEFTGQPIATIQSPRTIGAGVEFSF